jgi:hypothetical protein
MSGGEWVVANETPTLHGLRQVLSGHVKALTKPLTALDSQPTWAVLLGLLSFARREDQFVTEARSNDGPRTR